MPNQSMYLYGQSEKGNSVKIGLNPNHPDYETSKDDPAILRKISKRPNLATTNPSVSSLNANPSQAVQNQKPEVIASDVAERFASDVEPPRNSRASKEWKQGLSMSLGVASLLVAIAFCYLASQPYQLAGELSMTPQEVDDIADPASRLLAKSKIPVEARQAFANSGDGIMLGSAVFAYVFRLFTIMNPRTGEEQNARPSQAIPTGQQQPATNGHVTGPHAGQLAGWGNFAATN